ncbi:hypothetical protein HS045_31755 [Planomonospora sp. ID82291]|nr:hypothetical protein [Planomonospora sp. ID82291]
MRQRRIGLIATPAQGNHHVDGAVWAADNGCFGAGYPGDGAYLAWLASRHRWARECLFATAPDVVGDAAQTLARSAPLLPAIRAAGYRAALVAQDGLEELAIPWPAFDALFLGGTTAWKLGAAARAITAEAVRRGVPVHMGRVNSLMRLRYATAIGCASADGTFLTFGPDRNLPVLLGWVRDVTSQDALFPLDF